MQTTRWFLVLVLVSTGAILPQPAFSQATEAELTQLFNAGDWARTMGVASQLVAAPGGNQRRARLLGGHAAARLGRHDRALEFLTEAVILPPRDRDWTLGVEGFVEALMARGFWYRAAQWALELGHTEPERALSFLEQIPSGVLSFSELHFLGWMVSPLGTPGQDREACGLLDVLVGLAPNGSALEAELAAAAIQRCRGSARAAELAAHFPGVQEAPIGFYDIALVAPINGIYARFGESLVQGAYLALDEANRTLPRPMRLRVMDSAGDPLHAAYAAARAVRAGFGAIVGDLLNAPTIAVAAAAQAGRTPHVSPAAGRTDLGAVGDYVFQTVVPREVQAEALARAAVRRFGHRRVAVVYPDDEDTQRVAERFAGLVKRLGGDVVAQTPYPPGQTNFAPELEPLAQYKPEVVFVPGNPRELMAIVPQFSYYEVDARIFGLAELGMNDVLDATAAYLDSAVFAESFYRVPDERLREFSSAYQQLYGRVPDDFATRGYVALKVLSRAVAGGVRSRVALAQALGERVGRFGKDDRRGILMVDDIGGDVALFEARGSQVVPID